MKRLSFCILCLISSAICLAQEKGDTTFVRKLARQIKDKRYWSTYPDSLVYCADKGIAVASAIHDDYGIADMHKFYGIQYWSTGDHKNAIEHYELGKSLYEKLGKEFEAAQMTSNLGMVYARLGANDKAISLYQRAVAVMEKMPVPDKGSIASTISSMGLLLRNIGDLKTASELFHRSR